MSAEELKTKGNAAMSSRNFEEAVKFYTQAIEVDPNNHVLYSNRSAAYVSLGKYEEALQDGEKTITIDPKFTKGYSRKGLALYKLDRIDEALETYEEGLKVEPENAALKDAIKEIQASTAGAGANLFGSIFKDPALWGLLQTDPELRTYLQQPDFVNMINTIQQNPNSVQLFMQDKRLMAVISKLLMRGQGMGGMGGESPQQQQQTPPQTSTPKASEPTKKQESAPEPEPAGEVSEERAKANKEKELGNDLYKAKKFAEAIAHYQAAIDLDNTEITFYTNKAAAHFEAKEYEQAIKECETGIEIGRSHGASFEQIAKAYARIGAAYRKLGKLDLAVDAYRTSLTENRVRAVQTTLRQVEKEKEEADRLAYLNPEVAQQEKEKGNEFFQKGDFPKAVACYTEAINRDPKCAALYSNRAAAYTKLADWGYALKDCETCLELDPTYIKAYKRKASLHNFMKDYHKAIDTYKTALTYAPEDQELKDGLRQASYLGTTASNDPAVREQRRQRAMADPEIQRILKNPMIERLLANLSPGGDQQAGMKMMNDPAIAADFEKLVASGAIALG